MSLFKTSLQQIYDLFTYALSTINKKTKKMAHAEEANFII